MADTRAQIITFIRSQITDALNRQNTAQVVRGVLEYMVATTYNPADDTITIAQVQGLTDALASKASLIDGKVDPLQLPALGAVYWGGMSKADGDVQTIDQAIQAAIDALVNAAPEQLNTLNELAAALEGNATMADAFTAELAKKINLTEKGAPLGVATLDAEGKIPLTQLPPYLKISDVHSDDYSSYTPYAEGNEDTSIIPAQLEDGSKIKWSFVWLKDWLFNTLAFVKSINGEGPDANGNIDVTSTGTGSGSGISWIVPPKVAINGTSVSITNVAPLVPIADWNGRNINYSVGVFAYDFSKPADGLVSADVLLVNAEGAYEVREGERGTSIALPAIPNNRLVAAYLLWGAEASVVYPSEYITEAYLNEILKGYVKTVNNIAPDVNGNVNITVQGGGDTVADSIINGNIVVNNVEQQVYDETNVTNALGNKVDKVAGEGLTPEKFTTLEKQKLAGLDGPHFKGTHPTLAALQTAHPTAVAGNNAHVDAGAGADVQEYIWDVSDGKWVLQQGASTAETAASIKTKYESNPDTNAFTDTLRVKLIDLVQGVTTWLGLSDTPSSYLGMAGKFTKVKATEDGIEFADAPTGGASYTFDTTPTAASTNPVTSDGIKSYVDAKAGGQVGGDFKAIRIALFGNTEGGFTALCKDKIFDTDGTPLVVSQVGGGWLNVYRMGNATDITKLLYANRRAGGVHATGAVVRLNPATNMVWAGSATAGSIITFNPLTGQAGTTYTLPDAFPVVNGNMVYDPNNNLMWVGCDGQKKVYGLDANTGSVVKNILVNGTISDIYYSNTVKRLIILDRDTYNGLTMINPATNAITVNRFDANFVYGIAKLIMIDDTTFMVGLNRFTIGVDSFTLTRENYYNSSHALKSGIRLSDRIVAFNYYGVTVLSVTDGKLIDGSTSFVNNIETGMMSFLDYTTELGVVVMNTRFGMAFIMMK